MFRGFAEGYLSEARAFLTPAETDALAFSVRYITYEQVLRFLMDYLDGDTYYKIKSPDHNLVRTRAQYALLRSAEERYDAMQGDRRRTSRAALTAGTDQKRGRPRRIHPGADRCAGVNFCRTIRPPQ